MVGVFVGVFVGGTGVFVGVLVGVFVGGTGVLVGVSVSLGVAVSVGVLVAVLVGVLVGVLVAVGVKVGHFFGCCPLGTHPAVGCGVFGLAACVDTGVLTPNMSKIPISSMVTTVVSFAIAPSFVLLGITSGWAATHFFGRTRPTAPTSDISIEPSIVR